MEQEDYENEYFQDYGDFSYHDVPRFTIEHQELSQNQFPVEMRQPLSLELSQPIDNSSDEKAVEPTRDYPQTTNIPPISYNILEPSSQNQPVFDTNSYQKYRTVFQGFKDDTMQLNTNFKTILVGFFREMMVANQLNPNEIKSITKFGKRVPSFSSLKELFRPTLQNENIRTLCLNFFSSSECIKRIMISRSKTKTKLMMIKYIQKIRLNILHTKEIIKWKDIIKNNG